MKIEHKHESISYYYPNLTEINLVWQDNLMKSMLGLSNHLLLSFVLNNSFHNELWTLFQNYLKFANLNIGPRSSEVGF